jgi:hypothetical protein
MVTAFFPLTYSSVPMTRGRLVRLEVPHDTLVAFGLGNVAPTEGMAPDVILADVIVGDDGLARAVRFVRRIPSEMQKERQP